MNCATVPTTYTVNTTDDVDDGACNAAHCSLREAINISDINRLKPFLFLSCTP